MKVDQETEVKQKLATIDDPKEKDEALSEFYLDATSGKLIAVGVFLFMAVILFFVGTRKSPELTSNGKHTFDDNNSGGPEPHTE